RPTRTRSSTACAQPRGYRVRTRRRGPRPRGMTSMSRRAAWRRFSSKPLEVGEPELDERADRLLQPRLARKRQRLLVALAGLRRIHALFQPVVAGDEQLLDLLTWARPLHKRTVAVQIYVLRSGSRSSFEQDSRPHRGRSPPVRGDAGGVARDR